MSRKIQTAHILGWFLLSMGTAVLFRCLFILGYEAITGTPDFKFFPDPVGLTEMFFGPFITIPWMLIGGAALLYGVLQFRARPEVISGTCPECGKPVLDKGDEGVCTVCGVTLVEKQSGLSTGAKVAIALVVCVAVLAALPMLAMLLLYLSGIKC